MDSAEKARLRRSPEVSQGWSWSLPAVAADTRLRYAGACVAIALAAGMILSPDLWLTRPHDAPLAESFPQVPPLPILRLLALPSPFDSILVAGTLVLCAAATVAPRRLVFAALFVACLLLAAPDLMRWQPWFYLYAGVVGTLAFVPRRASKSPGGAWPSRLLAWANPLQVLRILVGSVYLHSGLNKLNAAFFEERLEGFLAGMRPVVSDGLLAEALTYSAPFVEVTAGLGLLLGGYRIRHAAMALAASTNLFVLSALIPAGANIVVWPWDVAMIALVGILFAGRDENEQLIRRGYRRGAKLLPGHLYAVAVITLFAVMPAFGLLGYWPSYLSFALYSENTPSATVYVHGSDGQASVTEIAYERLNVPAYPSSAVYEAVGELACEAGQPSGPVLAIRHRPDLLTGLRANRSYTCSELPGRKKDPETTDRPG